MDGLGFQIRGFGPSVVHAVGKGMKWPAFMNIWPNAINTHTNSENLEIDA